MPEQQLWFNYKLVDFTTYTADVVLQEGGPDKATLLETVTAKNFHRLVACLPKHVAQYPAARVVIQCLTRKGLNPILVPAETRDLMLIDPVAALRQL